MKGNDMRKMTVAKDVDEYISAAPKEVKAKLVELRKILKAVAPESRERINYGMPYYDREFGLGFGSLVPEDAFNKYGPRPGVVFVPTRITRWRNASGRLGFDPTPGSLPLGCKLASGQVQRTSVQCHRNDRKSPGGPHALGIAPSCRCWIAAQTHLSRQSDRGRLLLSCCSRRRPRSRKR